MRTGFGLAIAVCAALAISGSYLGPQALWMVYVFKPLATVLILAFAFTAFDSARRYRRAVLAGLVFSLAGDVFLMLPTDLFLAGLLSFLLAHVCYLAAFTTGARLLARKAPFAAVGICAAVILWRLWPGIPAPMKIPVMVYVVLLASMSAQAGARWMALRTRPAACAAAGGILFLASDALLAFNRFAMPFAASTVLVLGTYYAAQLLIATSVREPSAPTPEA